MYIQTLRKALFVIIPLSVALAIIIPAFRPGFGEGEFIAYWSSAHLFVTGGNPYNPESLKAIESATRPGVDFDQGVGLQVWNPPWLMMLLIPIGLLSFDLAVRVWILINVALVGFTSLILWTEFFHPQNSKGFAFVIGTSFLFFETLNLIIRGQITLLVLVILILAILFLRSGKDTVAGSLLILTTIKPHLTYLVLALLMLWIIRQHKWKVLYGMAIVILLSVIIVSIILPNWISSYANLLTNFPYQKVVTTTIGGYLFQKYGITFFNYAGFLLLPLILPLQKLIEKNEWLTAVNVTLLVSLPLSLYGFSFDEVLLLPAIAQMVYWVLRKCLLPFPSFVTVTAIITIYVLRYSTHYLYEFIPYHYLIWQPLALCMVYLYSWRTKELRYEHIQITV